jgi:hypothetical protein
MTVDADYLERFEKEVELLRGLKKVVDEAIATADKQLEELRAKVKK